MPTADYRIRRKQFMDLMLPSKVRPHHVPRWLDRHLSEVLKVRGVRPSSCHSLYDMITALGVSPSFLDHWGTIDSGSVFVSEPYLSDRQLRSAIEFADAANLQLTISAVSEWNPPSTIRLAFRVNEPISSPPQPQAT